jgi:hypothetical protein
MWKLTLQYLQGPDDLLRNAACGYVNSRIFFSECGSLPGSWRRPGAVVPGLATVPGLSRIPGAGLVAQVRRGRPAGGGVPMIVKAERAH